MKIWVANKSDYTEHPIEYLAELIHPMAAVAWDRDMADVVLEPDPANVYPVLRFNHWYNRSWAAFSGRMGRVVAWWDKEFVCWRNGIRDIGTGERQPRYWHNPTYDTWILKIQKKALNQCAVGCRTWNTGCAGDCDCNNRAFAIDE